MMRAKITVQTAVLQGWLQSLQERVNTGKGPNATRVGSDCSRDRQGHLLVGFIPKQVALMLKSYIPDIFATTHLSHTSPIFQSSLH